MEAHPYSVNLKNEISHSNLLISIFKFTDFIQLSKAQQIEISNEKSEISKKKARSVRLTIPDVPKASLPHVSVNEIAEVKTEGSE